jgi:hypothetical protein
LNEQPSLRSAPETRVRGPSSQSRKKTLNAEFTEVAEGTKKKEKTDGQRSGNGNEKGGGPGLPASRISPFGESGQSDGGRLAGRVLACLYNPGNVKKVPEGSKKVAKITVEM